MARTITSSARLLALVAVLVVLCAAATALAARTHQNEVAGSDTIAGAQAIPFPFTAAPASPTNPNYSSGHFTANAGFSAEGGETVDCDADAAGGADPVRMAQTIWWTIVTDGSAIDLKAKGADTVVSVYDDGTAAGDWVTPSGAPTGATCADDTNGAADRTATFQVPAASAGGPAAGSTLYIQVGVYDCTPPGTIPEPCDGDGPDGTIHLAVEPPPNDDAANSLDVSAGGEFAQFTSGATLQNEDGAVDATDELSACGASAFGKTVWAVYTATAAGTLELVTNGTSERAGTPPLDTVLSVYNGSDGALIGCNDERVAGSDPGSALSITVAAGSSYYVQVGGRDDGADSPDSGLLTLRVSFVSGAPLLPPPPPPPPAPGPRGGGLPGGAPPAPPPVRPARVELGRAARLRHIRGVVTYRVPGSARRVLRDEAVVPFGTVVDSSRGVVQLITARNRARDTQSGRFSLGVFSIGQRLGNPLTELTLRGGSFRSCRAGRGSAAVLGGRRVRRLFGSAKGRFRTKGRYSSATVRGTQWTVEDRCAGTLTRVRSGSVAVSDFSSGRTVMVRAGRRTGRSGGLGSYLAGPR